MAGVNFIGAIWLQIRHHFDFLISYVHFKLSVIAVLGSGLLELLIAREEVDLELKGAFFLADNLGEEFRVIAVELSVVRVGVDS